MKRKLVALVSLVALLDAAADWQRRCIVGCGISYEDSVDMRGECAVRCAFGDDEVPEWHIPDVSEYENVNEIAPD